jgi:hypothetical protein
MKQSATRDLYTYWNSRRGDAATPDRKAIDPVAIPRLLPDVLLIERPRSRGTRVRLAGTRLCELFGRELRGTDLLSLWDEDSREETLALVDAVLDGRDIAVAGVQGRSPEQRSYPFELILLPLAGSSPRQAIGCLAASAAAARPLRTITALSLESVHLSCTDDESLRGSACEDAPRPLAHSGARRVGRFLVYEGGVPFEGADVTRC